MNANPALFKKTGLLAAGTTMLLLVPYLAMQFSTGVKWSTADFIVAGILLFGTGFGYLLITQQPSRLAFKLGTGLAMATGLFVIWSNLAVGIIGSEDQPVNLIYFGLLLAAFAGAVYYRFRARGMARVLFGLAAAQMVLAVLAIAAGLHHLPGASVAEILLLNGFFSLLWSAAAGLLMYDGQELAGLS